MRFRRFEVVEDSMRPALAPGDYLLGTSGATIRRFDIVAFEHPSRTGFWMVKRVIALPGETLDLDTGTIDGKPFPDPHRDVLMESGTWSVPDGSMFVMSDDRSVTRADSRTLGPVPIQGAYLVWLRYWPRPSIGRIRAVGGSSID